MISASSSRDSWHGEVPMRFVLGTRESREGSSETSEGELSRSWESRLRNTRALSLQTRHTTRIACIVLHMTSRARVRCCCCFVLFVIVVVANLLLLLLLLLMMLTVVGCGCVRVCVLFFFMFADVAVGVAPVVFSSLSAPSLLLSLLLFDVVDII